MTPRNRISLILSALLVVIGIVTIFRTALGGGEASPSATSSVRR